MNSSVVRFGAFEANFRSGELRKSGIRLKLPGQPLQVLEVLLEQPGAVITRDDLRRRLWPADTYVDFDNALNTAVNKLREALSDTAANPRFIETLPRRGYRFLFPVEIPGLITRRASPDATPMLAVLPFENLGGDPEQEYFADGLTEEMISQLGRLHAARLGVIARTSAIQYKGTHKSIHEIARELGVDFLLEGTVRRAGERVRITAQLIRATDQVHLWAESYDRTLGDILGIQTDVADRIGRSLAMELLPGPRASHANGASTVDTVAYEAYLKGRFHWNRRTEEGFKKATGLLSAVHRQRSPVCAALRRTGRGLQCARNVQRAGLESLFPAQRNGRASARGGHESAGDRRQRAGGPYRSGFCEVRPRLGLDGRRSGISTRAEAQP